MFTVEEQKLADKLLNTPYTFIQLHAALSYCSPELWTYLWEHGNYSLKTNIGSISAPLLENIEPTEEDYLLLLQGQGLTLPLLQKCLKFVEPGKYPPIVAGQFHLTEQQILDEGKLNPAFLSSVIQHGRFSARNFSEPFLNFLLQHNREEATTKILTSVEVISPTLLKAILQPELPTNLFWQVVDKVDMTALPEDLMEPLLLTLFSAKFYSAKEITLTLKREEWQNVVKRFWATQGVDSDKLPEDFVNRSTLAFFLPEGLDAE